jgi:hypothetical protein
MAHVEKLSNEAYNEADVLIKTAMFKKLHLNISKVVSIIIGQLLSTHYFGYFAKAVLNGMRTIYRYMNMFVIV